MDNHVINQVIMVRPKIEDNIRKLTRMGRGAMGILLPAAGVRSLGWKEHQNLIVKKIHGGFVIHEAKTKRRHE